MSASPLRSNPTAVGTGRSLPSVLISLFVSGPAPMVREKGISCMRNPRAWNQIKGCAAKCGKPPRPSAWVISPKFCSIPLFYGYKLVQPRLKETDRGKASPSGVVMQVPAPGSGEPGDARRFEAVAFVHHEVAEVLAEGREQDVDVES